MRKGTKSFLGIVSLGLVAAGYQAGQATPATAGFTALATAPISSTPSASGQSAAQTAAQGATPASSATTASSATPSNAGTQTPTKTNAAAPTNTPAPTQNTTSTTSATSAPTPAQTTAPAPSAASVTKSGSSVTYRYGTLQVSVTKSAGKITAVNMLQAGATGGRQGAFSYLTQYAVDANGSGFGSVGGATFTTDAFKQSLESALAKF